LLFADLICAIWLKLKAMGGTKSLFLITEIIGDNLLGQYKKNLELITSSFNPDSNSFKKVISKYFE